jgi:hypothetical protein
LSTLQTKTLRVAVNAQILPAQGAGGVESILIGLIHALGQLNDGPEEYTIIGPWQNSEWLRPYIAKNQQIISGPKIQKTPRSLLILRRLPFARKSRNFLRTMLGISQPNWPEVPISDGFYEKLGCNVVHFPYQDFTLCALPTIYNPHDLQHRHYPQFFSPSTMAWRETI